jgi:superfamily II DNA or RNA helicase
MAFLISKGLVLPIEGIDHKIIKKIKRKLTVEHRGFNMQIKTIQAFRSDKKYLTLAHAMGYRLVRDLLPNVEIENLLSIGDKIKLEKKDVNIKLENYQKTIANYLINYIYTPKRLKKGKGRCIFELKAGMGKTFIAMYLIYKWGRKALYIVPGENLIIQTKNIMEICFPTLTIGTYYGKAHKDGDIVIASIDSLYKEDKLIYDGGKISIKDWFSKFGVCIIDEVQLFCTSKRAEIFRRISSNIVIGMSATTNDRQDHMDRVSHYYLGDPIIISEELKDELPEDEKITYKVNVTKLEYSGPDEFTKIETTSSYNATKGETVECTSHPKMINQFSGDPYRNQLVVDLIMKHYEKGHKGFTFFDRRRMIEEFLPYIRDKFDPNIVAAPELEVKSVMGKASPEDRQIAKEKSKICMITYQCGGVGLSYPQYTAVIFAHSRRNNYKQFNNRIFRLDGPREIVREIVYISDVRTTLKSQYSGFKKSLLEEYPDAKIKIEKIDYKDMKVSKEIIDISKKIRDHYAKTEDKDD